MSLLLVALGLATVALPAVAARPGRRLQPRHWANLVWAAMAGGAVIIEVGLLAEALPTVLSAAGVPALADACQRLLRPLLPVGAPLGWLAAVAGVAGPFGAGVGVLRARRHQRQVATAFAWLGHSACVAGRAVTLIANEQAVALSLGGDQPRIVVSESLLATLSPAEVEVVVRHEEAHLAHGHDRLLCRASGLASVLGWFPPARLSASVLRLALERVADECATAGSASDRQRLRLALLRVAGVGTPQAVAGLSDAATVVERVRALERPPVGSALGCRAVVYLAGSGMGAATGVTAVAWLGQVHTLVAMSGRCSA